MNGIIITNQEIGHNEYKIKRLKEEFTKVGVKIDCFINDGTIAIIENNRNKINLPKADFVIYLDKDYYLAKELEKAGYRLFNKADFMKLCDDKNFTNIVCALFVCRCSCQLQEDSGAESIGTGADAGKHFRRQ